MTPSKAAKTREQKFAYYMDLLSHDVLNNNQAVLGYLELILASDGLDKKVRKYAAKAVSHIRTSTILVDNVKRLMVTREIDPLQFRPVDLTIVMNRAEQEMSRMFPDKEFRVKLPSGIREIRVIGDTGAEDIVLNMLTSLVRLDPNEKVILEFRAAETSIKGQKFWRISLEDPTAQLPKIATDRPIDEAYDEDSSVAVKVVGMLFCRIMSTMLGGNFEVKGLKKTEPRGGLFETTLRKAD